MIVLFGAKLVDDDLLYLPALDAHVSKGDLTPPYPQRYMYKYICRQMYTHPAS